MIVVMCMRGGVCVIWSRAFRSICKDFQWPQRALERGHQTMLSKIFQIFKTSRLLSVVLKR